MPTVVPPSEVSGLWQEFDGDVGSMVLGADPERDAAPGDVRQAGFPEIRSRSLGSRRVHEVGTLGGYRAIGLARGVRPDGRRVPLEGEERHAAVAGRPIDRAGLSGRIDVRVGPALENFPRLETEGAGPLDRAFLDGDRPPLERDFDRAIPLSQAGSVNVSDTVVRRGDVFDAEIDPPDPRGVRRRDDGRASDPRIRASGSQTVGRTGYDRFALAVVVDPAGPSGGRGRAD